MAMHKTQRRTTMWTFVCYPESMPDGWESVMRSLHIPLAYIVHDRDRENGIKTKEHVHVLVKYESVKAKDQVADDFEFTGITYIEPVRSFNAMTRYLIHADDEDKAQYSPDDVVACSGISLDFSRHMSQDEQIDVMQQMTEFIEDNDIREFSALWEYAARHERNWLQMLMGKASYSVTQYIRSRSFAQNKAAS